MYHLELRQGEVAAVVVEAEAVGGIMKQYSAKAMPHDSSMMNISGVVDDITFISWSLRWPYQANVMKMLDITSSSIVVQALIILETVILETGEFVESEKQIEHVYDIAGLLEAYINANGNNKSAQSVVAKSYHGLVCAAHHHFVDGMAREYYVAVVAVNSSYILRTSCRFILVSTVRMQQAKWLLLVSITFTSMGDSNEV